MIATSFSRRRRTRALAPPHLHVVVVCVTGRSRVPAVVCHGRVIGCVCDDQIDGVATLPQQLRHAAGPPAAAC